MLAARTINYNNICKCSCSCSNRTIVAPKVKVIIDESVVLGIYKKFNLNTELLQPRKFEEE